MITLYDLTTPKKPKVALNAHTLNLARNFVLDRWQARAKELGLDKPEDLTNSCKFSSLFVQRIFGGSIEANECHCYNRINGIVVDLNEFAMDVLGMDEPYLEDPDFLEEPEFHESLSSCQARVSAWVSGFYELAQERGYALPKDQSPGLSYDSPSPQK
ncbi:MAG: hypothetical protein RSG77_17885 [Hafnia sp.]